MMSDIICISKLEPNLSYLFEIFLCTICLETHVTGFSFKVIFRARKGDGDEEEVDLMRQLTE